jgi:ADP-ribosylglycohydrolase
MACLILVKFASELMDEQDKSQMSRIHVYARVMAEMETFFQSRSMFKSEISHFERLFNTAPRRLQELNNTGYVIHSLEIVLHSFIKYNRFERVVIDVIKKGGDTDTNACSAGGLAGLCYGERTIPSAWLNQLVKRKEICDLSVRWAQTLN